MLVNNSSKSNTASTSFSLRTNLYRNAKFNAAAPVVKGNASPLTTQSGRISIGSNGVFWSGQLAAWDVYMPETKSWSGVMYNEKSTVSGLISVVIAQLEILGVIDEETTDEEFQSIVETIFGTTTSFEIPHWSEEDVVSLHEQLEERPLNVNISVELSIGLKEDGGFSVKGVIVADPELAVGKLSIVAQADRLKIEAKMSRFAQPAQMDQTAFAAKLKGGLKNQQTKNQERKNRFAVKAANNSTQASTSTPVNNITAVAVNGNTNSLPPAV